MLSVTNKPLMLNVVMLSVFMALDSNPQPLDDEESQRILPELEGSVRLTSYY